MRLKNIEDLVGRNVKILSTQTTFMIVEFLKQDYQINFDSKKEFHFIKGTEGYLNILNKHPLLTNYQDTFVEIFINSPYPQS
ncbi:hypothetical protein [Frigoriflavimonas asaccharolytica]|uniref:F0F1-type ATP synthase epsilon subunit n=1 Tax=Frigoriflavimonas asaccharolytica TaxID=2735899 RepID=A0A8J8GAI9_9FLAO|nr:hypothetical protein [Frigoriflavimonas asaccharolytica]NRS92639.1 F0F1-type ATP synthase epsilon subunit [Frigoriflavimonas asaccharolytica]